MAFSYRNGRLHSGTDANSTDLIDLAKRFDGPIYVYDLNDILERVRRLKNSFGNLPTTLH